MDNSESTATRRPEATLGSATGRSLWRTATIVTDDPGTPLATISEPDEDSETDVEITKRYDIREVLGTGGMGEVRLCRDEAIGRDVAHKTLLTTREVRPGARGRFLREARIQGQLEHPAIVPVYDLGHDADGELFFTMRRVRGHTLSEVLDSLAHGDVTVRANFSRRKLLGAFVQVCLAVDYAHTRGVIHRDLKPSNVMVGNFGEVYVLDWGVARLASEQATGEPVVLPHAEPSGTGAVAGTPGYMSPEQLRGRADVQDARTDVYALGAILYELLTLQPLHRGRTAAELVSATLREVDARASNVVADVPPELDAVCVRATALNPADRFDSARGLANAVEHYLDGDRDTARRRELAEVRTESAAQAIARLHAPDHTNGTSDDRDDERDRADAMREVLAALALDAENERARRLLVRLFVEVPSRLPPGVEAEMSEATGRNREQFVRWGSYALISWVFTAPVATLMGVNAWMPVLLTTLLSLASLGMAVWLRRAKSLTVRRLLVLGAFVFLTLASVSCYMGPFVLVPQAVAVATLWMSVQCRERSERNIIITMGVLAVAVPFLLEFTHLFSPAYTFVNGAVVLHARSIAFASSTTLPMLFYSSITFVALPAIFFSGIRTALIKAERQLFLQAWHLRQLATDAGATA